MTILGEVALDEYGVLHGWCWSPDRPAERLTVDIAIDEVVVSSMIASRFREDLRFRKYGDGYHGFTVTLTKHIAAASARSVVNARERSSGYCFWQKVFGEFAIPEDFPARVADIRAGLDDIAHAAALAPEETKTAQISTAFAALGTTLRARAGNPVPPAASRPFTLAALARPAFSVILDAGADGAATLQEIRAAAGTLGDAGAEVILTDDGADPAMLGLQLAAENLKYLHLPGQSPAARRNLATAIARGDTLVFLQHARGLPGTALKARLGQPPVIVISTAIAEAARRIAPKPAAGMTIFSGPNTLGLHAILPRQFLAAHGKFDLSMDDGAGLDILDWVLRAAEHNAPIAIWHPAFAAAPSAPPSNTQAGRYFAERWITRTAFA